MDHCMDTFDDLMILDVYTILADKVLVFSLQYLRPNKSPTTSRHALGIQSYTPHQSQSILPRFNPSSPAPVMSVLSHRHELSASTISLAVSALLAGF